MAEVVFRNKPMFDFVFKSDLYHQQGLQRVFKRSDDYLKTRNTPYRPRNLPNALTVIDFPADALMIKSNWLNEKRALAIGLREDPNNPYIKMTNPHLREIKGPYVRQLECVHCTYSIQNCVPIPY